MAQLFYGSIDYDKLLEELKKGTLKVHKSEKGKRYININVYVADIPNEYGNIASISVPFKEEFQREENGKQIKNHYIGNMKKAEPSSQEASASDFEDDEDDDLPF